MIELFNSEEAKQQYVASWKALEWLVEDYGFTITCEGPSNILYRERSKEWDAKLIPAVVQRTRGFVSAKDAASGTRMAPLIL